jgi:hypothetical protein
VSDQKPDPIPVIQIIRNAVIIPWRKRATMFWALLSTSVVLTVAHMIAPLARQELGWISTLISVVLFGLAFALFAVTCHRLVLLGDHSVPKYGLIRWSSRETRFVGWTLLIYLCAWVAAVVPSILAFQFIPYALALRPSWAMFAISFFAIIVLPAYLFARLAVLFPATAVDERPSLAWAWKVTEGNGWRLFLVVGVLPVALWLGPGYLVNYLVAHLLRYAVIVYLLIYVTGCVLYIIEIAALSLSYKHLTGRNSYSVDN